LQRRLGFFIAYELLELSSLCRINRGLQQILNSLGVYGWDKEFIESLCPLGDSPNRSLAIAIAC
jgi:hypothetical protein